MTHSFIIIIQIIDSALPDRSQPRLGGVFLLYDLTAIFRIEILDNSCYKAISQP